LYFCSKSPLEGGVYFGCTFNRFVVEEVDGDLEGGVYFGCTFNPKTEVEK
jgi:hypothetical protein